jgi:hypothetical protein
MKSFLKRKCQERKSLEQGIIIDAIDLFFVLLLLQAGMRVRGARLEVGVGVKVARVAARVRFLLAKEQIQKACMRE